MMTIESEILDEAQHDWVSFAFIAECVGQYEGFDQGETARSQRAVDVAVDLVAAGTLVAGDLARDGFAPWVGAGEGVVARLRQTAEQTIRENGYIPLGEACWFAAPELLARPTP